MSVPLDSREKRRKLVARREPYWHKLERHQYLGYRRLNDGGTWIAKGNDASGKRVLQALGVADDNSPADGVNVLTRDQAKKLAEEWFGKIQNAQIVKGSRYTVGTLLDDYLKDRDTAGAKGIPQMRSVIERHIRPQLGHVDVKKLKAIDVERWFDAISQADPLIRTKDGMGSRTIDRNDADAKRKRRATANRIFTVLCAALNYGKNKRYIHSRDAWDGVKKHKLVDAPKVQFLSAEQCVALLNACPPDFRKLVGAALLTGMRYGELISMKASAFDDRSKTLHIPTSKSGKSRHVVLTHEGAEFFSAIAKSKFPSDNMFSHEGGREDGKAWLPTQQTYWMKEACAAAALPMVSFHVLRHTYASLLVVNGTPIAVIRELLGHADSRMTERHYAHLSQNALRDAVQSNLPTFGVL